MVGRDNPPPQRGSEAELQALRAQVRALTGERAALTRRAQSGERAANEVAAAVEAFEEVVASGHLDRPEKRSLGNYVELAAQQLAALAVREQAAVKRVAELEESHRALQEQLERGASTVTEALERIRTLQEQFDAQTAERDARIRELEAALAEARTTPVEGADEDETVRRLIEENRRLASEVEVISGDLATMQRAAREAKDSLDTVREETSARVRSELAGEIATMQRQHEILQKQLDLATQQLNVDGKSPALPADRVAEMLTTLIDQMQGGMPGLSIQTGELKLRVGLEAVGSGAGFVIPSSDSPAELRENLQEITLRFDNRSGLKP